VLQPPSADKLKIIHDLVAGVIGFSEERGDQLVIETLPFESTLRIEPPQAPGTAAPGAKPASKQGLSINWDRKTMILVGAVAAGVIVISLVGGLLLRGKKKVVVGVPTALPEAGHAAAPRAEIEGSSLEDEIEAKLAARDAMQKKADVEALSSLKLSPVITKTSEVLAKVLRERIAKEPEVSAQVLRTWIREDEEVR
jgi:flagellar biosynthesis/type III secretory pathway M-ring protein FliF/YscJ